MRCEELVYVGCSCNSLFVVYVVVVWKSALDKYFWMIAVGYLRDTKDPCVAPAHLCMPKSGYLSANNAEELQEQDSQQ